MPQAKTEDLAQYIVPPCDGRTPSMEDDIIATAIQILERRMGTAPREVFTSPGAVQQYLRLQLGQLPHECFGVMFLDAQNRLIEFEVMFRGTLTQTSVYPREVVKAALQHNAASVIFAHNHPSGTVQPSRADEQLTAILKDALKLIDVRTHDHVIVSGTGSLSMAEKGLL